MSPVRDGKEKKDRFRVVDTSGSGRKGLKRRGAKRYHKTWKDARARFKSSEDLIHRLYVCISGAADQLQTNFAGDFRHILKIVFLMNSTPEEGEEEEEGECVRGGEEEEEDKEYGEQEVEESQSDSEQDESLGSPEAEAPASGAAASGLHYTPARNSGYECGEDALMTETEQSFLRNFGGAEPGLRVEPALLSTSPPALANMPVYASNLDQHIDRAMLTEQTSQETFYQPEPTLLNIAAGAPQVHRKHRG